MKRTIQQLRLDCGVTGKKVYIKWTQEELAILKKLLEKRSRRAIKQKMLDITNPRIKITKINI